MRLHLDSPVQGAADASQAAPLGSTAPLSGSGAPAKAGGRRGEVSGSQDSIAISGPSSALNRLTSDRAGRIEQLSAAVRTGSYQIGSSVLSGAIVSHAVS